MIGTKIKEIRKSLGLTQEEFATRLGVTRGVITNLEFDKTTPKKPFVELICKEFGVNPEWMESGQGDMFLNDGALLERIGEILGGESDDFRQRVFVSLSRLDSDGWKALEQFTESISRAAGMDVNAILGKKEDQEN